MGPFQRQHVDPKKLPATVQAKWPVPLLDEGFVPFPKKLLRSLTKLFGASAELRHLALLLAVVDYQRPNLSRHPSVSYLGFLAGLDLSQTEKTLQELIQRNWATVDPVEDSDAVKVDLHGFFDDVGRSAQE